MSSSIDSYGNVIRNDKIYDAFTDIAELKEKSEKYASDILYLKNNNAVKYILEALPYSEKKYTFDDNVNAFVSKERCSVTIGNDAEKGNCQSIQIAANAGNKYGLAQMDLTAISQNATKLVIEYDSMIDGGRYFISLVDLAKRPGTSHSMNFDSVGVAFSHGTKDGRNYYVNGVNNWHSELINSWLHIKLTVDMKKLSIHYEISNMDGVVLMSGDMPNEKTPFTITGLEVYSWTAGTALFDNIRVAAFYDIDENGLYFIKNESGSYNLYTYINESMIKIN